ncbi:MAG: trypsin-like peptidase domain-containing protein [Hyphomicrobiaceae bacterium]
MTGIVGKCASLFGLFAGAVTAAPMMTMPAAATIVPSLGGDAVDKSNLQVVPVAVFGRDDRKSLPKRLRPLKKSIGLVYNNSVRSVCTGFCVADRLVATASHCLFRTAGERRPSLRKFQFVLRARSRWPSSRIEGYQVRAIDQFVVAGSRKLRIEPPIDATQDWALMRLSSPVCKGAVLPVASLAPKRLEQLAKRKALFQVSFHHDYANWRLAYSGKCTTRSPLKALQRKRISRDFNAPDNLVLHTCDTGGASSGSPLLTVDAKGRFQVVAVNVGTYVQTRLLIEEGKVVRRYKSDAVANTAIATRAFEGLIRPFSAANILRSAKDIRSIQQVLKQRGLYQLNVDGAFGPATRRAIQLFRGRDESELAGLPTRGLLTDLSKLVSPASIGGETAAARTRGRQNVTGGRLKQEINAKAGRRSAP